MKLQMMTLWINARRTCLWMLMMAVGVLTAAQALADVTLVKDGRATSVIVVPEGTMSWEGSDKPLNPRVPYEEEPQRRKVLLRDSVKDLAHYLQRISGGEVEVVTALPAGDTRTPVYIHAAGEKALGPVGIDKAGLFGFRVVVTDKAVGLYGQSEYGTSYAIYELLHQLGCRWYVPSEMGEVVPSSRTIVLKEMDRKLAPATLWRRMEGRTADADFRRRNRMGGGHDGGLTVRAHHALEGYITKEQREQHPEWCLHIDGKPHPRYLRWTREDVANAIADAIISKLDEKYDDTVSLSPGDYVVPSEDPEERKFDPDPRVWEPAANRWSVTDRLIMLANRVATRVNAKYPDVRFGVLAYVNYNSPPAREKVHPNVIPMIAPIDYNRHHPMTWPDHPNEYWLRDLLKGWAEKSPNLAYYAYGMNLAEITAPAPFITKWGQDLPVILASNVNYWTPETMNGWETMMPGFYISMRMTFNPQEKPEAILDELMEKFYGPAAAPMKRYWYGIDRAWIDSRQYAGSAFAYLKIFTPEVLAEARRNIDEALSLCGTIQQYRRVEMVNRSLSLLELFMKMRQDFAAGRFNTLERDLDHWRSSVTHLAMQYKAQYAFDSGLAVSYVDWQFAKPYREATRTFKEYRRLAQPLVKWKWQYDKEKTAEAQGWANADHDDKAWPVTHVVEDTWSSLGHHNTMGRMVYRVAAPVRFAARKEGKRVYLWIGSTDGSAKVFVNGKHVPYVVEQDSRQHKKGDVIDAFRGYCQPAMFDVTDVLEKSPVQITIICEREWLNELGTGGLMGPVLLLEEK